MRITGGVFKGRVVCSPGGFNTRPVTERIRKSIFDILSHTVSFSGMFLDLFAGSGIMGMEFMSRGGLGGIFVDSGGSSCLTIKRNLRSLGLEEKAFTLRLPVKRALSSGMFSPGEFEVIFVDPPFSHGFKDYLLSCLPLVHHGGVVVMRFYKGVGLPESIRGRVLIERIYGESRVIFAR